MKEGHVRARRGRAQSTVGPEAANRPLCAAGESERRSVFRCQLRYAPQLRHQARRGSAASEDKVLATSENDTYRRVLTRVHTDLMGGKLQCDIGHAPGTAAQLSRSQRVAPLREGYKTGIKGLDYAPIGFRIGCGRSGTTRAAVGSVLPTARPIGEGGRGSAVSVCVELELLAGAAAVTGRRGAARAGGPELFAAGAGASATGAG